MNPKLFCACIRNPLETTYCGCNPLETPKIPLETP